MSKKRQRFEQSSGWQARDGGSPRKDSSGPGGRRDLSEGSQRMADGGYDPAWEEIQAKERQRKAARATRGQERRQMQLTKDKLLLMFKRGLAKGKLGVSVRCPFCGGIFATAYFEVHVRSGH